MTYNTITTNYLGETLTIEYEYTPPFKGSVYNCDSDVDWYGTSEIVSAEYDSGEDCTLSDDELWKLIDDYWEGMDGI